MVVEDPLTVSIRKRVAAEAIRCRLPTVSGIVENAEDGLLLVYGASTTDRFRQAAVYVDRLLKGARAADLPVEQPTRFELIVNQRTARAIGIEVPPALLVQADQVIE